MFRNFRILASILLIALLPVAGSAAPAKTQAQEGGTKPRSRPTVGWVEKVLVHPPDVLIHAKLDTGAATSSLGATNVKEFKRGGETWVRFTVTNRYAEKVVIERKVHRIAIIKRHKGKYQRRQVIRLGICLGTTFMEADVNLIDRTNFEFQLLVGRNFLAGNAIVDSAITYTTEPACPLEHS